METKTIRDLRIENEISQDELAEVCDRARSWVQVVENTEIARGLTPRQEIRLRRALLRLAFAKAKYEQAKQEIRLEVRQLSALIGGADRPIRWGKDDNA